jgi:hypothetical protein
MSTPHYWLRFGRHQDQPGWFLDTDDGPAGAHAELGLAAAELPHTAVVPLRTYFVPLGRAEKDDLRKRIESYLGESQEVTDPAT